MAPPFATGRAALAFCTVVGLLLALPAILRAAHLPGHEDRLPTAPVSAGSYSFLQHEIFEETSDLDLVFVGDSLVFTTIDTPLVARALTRFLGRPAHVVTLAWLGRGEDMTFYVLRDLLAHRRVGAVVLRLPPGPGNSFGDGPHPLSYRWLTACAHDPVQPTLPWADRVSTYALESVGALRNLLSLARPNLLSTSPFASSLGAALWDIGPNHGPFTRFEPAVQVLSTTDLVSKLGDSPLIRSDHRQGTAYQRGYVSAIRTVLESHAVRLALFRLPTVTEARQTQMEVDGTWAELFPADTSVIGLAPERLYRQLSDAQVRELYFDLGHFNRNGAEYVTATLMPAFVELVTDAEKLR